MAGRGFALFGRLHAADEIDDAPEMAPWRLPGIWVQQLEFEYEFIGFVAAFRGCVVFAVEKIERTEIEVPVLGLGDVPGHRILVRLILVVIWLVIGPKLAVAAGAGVGIYI